MNIFGYFNVTKERTLWMNPPEKGVRRVLYLYVMNFSKLVQLNLLFLLFSLPIVTLPGSLSALTKVSLKIVTTEPYFLFSDFWQAFKSEYKKASLFFIPHTLCLAAAIYAIYYYLQQADNAVLTGVPLIISIIFTCFLICVGLYTYPMIVYMKLPLKAIIKNAMLLSLLCVKRNILLLIGNMIVVFIIVLLLPASIFLAALMMFSFLSLINSYNVQIYIKKYVINK